MIDSERRDREQGGMKLLPEMEAGRGPDLLWLRIRRVPNSLPQDSGYKERWCRNLMRI